MTKFLLVKSHVYVVYSCAVETFSGYIEGRVLGVYTNKLEAENSATKLSIKNLLAHTEFKHYVVLKLRLKGKEATIQEAINNCILARHK